MSHLRLFSIVVIIIVIPIIIITRYSFNLIINQARSRYIDSLNMETQQLSNTLSAELGNLLTVGRMIIADDRIRTTLNDYRIGAAGCDQAEKKLNEYMYEYEHTCFMASSLFPKITLITRDNETFGNTLAGHVLERPAFQNEIQALYGANRNVKWTSDSEIFPLEKSDFSSCLYLMLAMRDTNTFRAVGTVVIQLRANALASRILPNLYSYQTAVVTSKSGKRIVELDYLGVSNEFERWVNVDSIEVQSNQTKEKTVNCKDCVISNYSISKTDWNVLIISNMENYTMLKLTYLRNFIFAVSIILILSFLFAFRLSRQFMKPVVDLNNQMKLVKEGNFNAHLEPVSNDEIGELTRQFNDMVNHIQHLIDLNKREHEEKRISDMKFLQAQINPHFIYNTLTLLRYNISTNDKRQADNIILALNNILRYVLSDSNPFSTLNRALEWIRSYLIIVNCSLREPVEVVYDLEAGTGDCQIIRMLIQPLVENAAFHGLKKCESAPKLRISARIEGNDLIIAIWDNGPGFNTSALSRYKNGFERKSIGVDNVDRRIKLYFGEKYGVRYRSIKEGLHEGAEAIIVLPAIKKEERDVLINEYTDCR